MLIRWLLSRVNEYLTTISAAIRFQRIWLINEFGGLTGYSLVLVHCIGLTRIYCIQIYVHTYVYTYVRT